jgi:hypothetical protein
MNKKKEEKSKIVLGVSIIAIIAIIIIIIVAIVLLKNGTSSLESLAAKKYFEESFLDVNQLYMMAGKSDVDEVQYMQFQLKKALDSYFETSSETTVDANVIMGLINNPYNYNVDFNGLLASGYEYSQVDNSFTKVDGAYSDLAVIEDNTNLTVENYNDQTIEVEKIKKTGKDTYKIYANLISSDGTADLSNEEEDGGITGSNANQENSGATGSSKTQSSNKKVEATAEIVIKMENDGFSLVECVMD